ncbi:hypothetical protein HY249_03160 [Candidatus Azambacteria bacterium]|nr:hypothetical protein [Candidatus Azambacteria bacterium]
MSLFAGKWIFSEIKLATASQFIEKKSENSKNPKIKDVAIKEIIRRLC